MDVCIGAVTVQRFHEAIAFRDPYAASGRTAPCSAINDLRAIRRFDRANSVGRWAVFFCRHQKRTFTSPNWRLIGLLGLAHLRVALAFFVLRDTERWDDGGIHDAAFL